MTPETETIEQSASTANDSMEGWRASWPRFAVVSVDDIYVDLFQRPLDERWLRQREGKLDPAKLQTIMLSERARRGKQFSAVDGQHRIELVVREFDAGRIPEKVLPAAVFYDLTLESEAQLFADFQLGRRSITAYQRFNAELIGGSERAKAIDKIVREEGYVLGDVEQSGHVLKAVRRLETTYDHNPALLRQVLRLVRGAWGDLPGSSSDRMLAAVFFFLRNTEDVNEDRFIERVGSYTPATLVTRAHNLREFKGVHGALPKFLAEAVSDVYHSKRSVRK